ncbi:glucose-6-phosphate dehydrogenase [Amycolatopsis sp. RTGN1]|uniref:glucose-6-phosphate dehydrogenase n=1 Tax=Amycolatopsis ponsaeliensis TaxID=2992142 RepID=UPI0025510F2F|nr:glucose-6-phosphate dehydrogenase [Amycolatopsis sp. RTGN1]
MPEPGWTASTLVIFGITGDLAGKMTLPALYQLERRGALDCAIIGVASAPLTTHELVERARRAIEKSGGPIDDAVFTRLSRRLTYLGGDATDPHLYESLATQLGGGRRRPLYYLATPPALFAPIVERLGAAGLLVDARVALEKPFGSDLATARELQSRLHQILEDRQLLLVDHFLGKEPVIEIEYLRFANFAMAELWHRDSVESVQITMAENHSVAGRGKFYDSVGAVRDVVQNHLLQVLALVAMDAPIGSSVAELRAKKLEVLKAIPAVDVRQCVRGQYDGYLAVPGVAADSDTETFVALRLEIDSWRWAGVPVLIRAGKHLPVNATEVRLVLRHTPRLRFLPDAARVEANQIVLRISPTPGLRLQLSGLGGNDSWRPVRLDTTFARDLGVPQAPYERLLHDALAGDDRLFAWQDAVEESWRILRPLVAYPPRAHEYRPGTWGPVEADALLPAGRDWQAPWLPDSN